MDVEDYAAQVESVIPPWYPRRPRRPRMKALEEFAARKKAYRRVVRWMGTALIGWAMSTLLNVYLIVRISA